MSVKINATAVVAFVLCFFTSIVVLIILDYDHFIFATIIFWTFLFVAVSVTGNGVAFISTAAFLLGLPFLASMIVLVNGDSSKTADLMSLIAIPVCIFSIAYIMHIAYSESIREWAEGIR